MKIIQGPRLQSPDSYRQELLAHGVLVFRGFPVNSLTEFEAFAKVLDPEISHYHGQTDRSQLSNLVYETTPLPLRFAVAPHSETSYSNCYPQRGFFYCEVAPAQGGETVFIDNRIMLKALEQPLLEKFRSRGVSYIRNLPSRSSLLVRFLRLLKIGFIKGWEDLFFTADRKQLMDFCREHRIPARWLEGDWLSLNVRLPATRVHPRTGEEVWFNQCSTFRITRLTHGFLGYYLNRLIQLFSRYTLLDANWGDGEVFLDSEIAAVKNAYAKNVFAHVWQPGDVVFFDNLLVSHGRNPTRGKRKVYGIFSAYTSATLESE